MKSTGCSRPMKVQSGRRWRLHFSQSTSTILHFSNGRPRPNCIFLSQHWPRKVQRSTRLVMKSALDINQCSFLGRCRPLHFCSWSREVNAGWGSWALMTSIFTAFFITPRFELNLIYFKDNYNLKLDSLSWLLTYQSDTRQAWAQRQSPTIKKNGHAWLSDVHCTSHA